MNIALLNERVMIQKNAVMKDEIGNHVNEWEDYYSCHATISGSSGGGQSGSQDTEAGQTVDVSDISFTVRFCKKTVLLDVVGYRIIYRGEIYDIISIDYMNFKKKLLKIRCKKVRR